MKKLTINVYTIDELKNVNKQAYDVAISDHLNFLKNTSYTTDTLEDIEERKHYTRRDALEGMQINEYYLYDNGQLIDREIYDILED